MMSSIKDKTPGIEITHPSEKKSFSLGKNNHAPIKNDFRFIPKEYKDVALSMEQQFAEIMINEMNKSKGENSELSQAGMDFYESLETNERAKILASQNSLGLQETILNQIYPKRLRNEFSYQQYQKQMEMVRNSLIKNQNLPTLNKPEKSDTIKIERNDSSLETSKDSHLSKLIDGIEVQGASE